MRQLANLVGGTSAQAVHKFEKNEASGALTLRNLDRVAAAMGCRVVYVLVPARDGQTFSELAAGLSSDRRLLGDTEHTMSLEGQDVGNVAGAKRGIRRGTANADARDGQRPQSPRKALALRVSIQAREELNAFERENILEARAWALSRRTLQRADLLTEDFMCDLHRRMFGRIWRWAGGFRTTERNVGRPVHALATDTRMLLEDIRYWREHETYPVIEAAVRFHYRLVVIHPWVNGNGRHARLMADIFVCAQGGAPLPWGRRSDFVAPTDAAPTICRPFAQPMPRILGRCLRLRLVLRANTDALRSRLRQHPFYFFSPPDRIAGCAPARA